MIQFLSHHEIDKQRWNSGVEKSGSLVYNYSWFLDAVCPSWGAIVDENYSHGIPLAIKKKFGISYVYAPTYAQQLGFSTNGIVEFPELLNNAPKFIRHFELKLPVYQEIIELSWKQKLFQNYILDLNKPYNELFANYSDNTKRNLKKARKSGLHLIENISIDEFIQFKIQNLAGKYQLGMYAILEKLIKASNEHGIGRIWALKDTDNKIHASVFWICTSNRSYYLSPTSSREGKESKAMFLMVDLMIQHLSGKEHVLDFEGSNIESIARFFQSFNSEKSLYLYLTKNLLPWPLKLIKP